MEDYYRIVNLDRRASTDEIDHAIREQLRIWQRRTTHADLDRRQEAERRVRLLSEARSVLLHEPTRRRYDQQLALRPPSEPTTDTGPDPNSLTGNAPAVSPLSSSARPAVISFRARTERLRTGWYVLMGGTALVLLVASMASVDSAALSLPLLIASLLAGATLALTLYREVTLEVDDQGIRERWATNQITHRWDDIRSVTVRQPLARGSAPAVLIVDGHRTHGATVRGVRRFHLGRSGVPVDEVRDALVRFAGSRLRDGSDTDDGRPVPIRPDLVDGVDGNDFQHKTGTGRP